MLEAVLYRGQRQRGDVDHLLAVDEREARCVTAALCKKRNGLQRERPAHRCI